MHMPTLTPILTRLYMPKLHGIKIRGKRSCVCGLDKHKIQSNRTTHDTSPSYVPYRHLNKPNTILTKTNPIQPTNLKREDEHITHHNLCTNVRSTTQLPSLTYRISLWICPRIYRKSENTYDEKPTPKLDPHVKIWLFYDDLCNDILAVAIGLIDCNRLKLL
jgi:hypothetical protein